MSPLKAIAPVPAGVLDFPQTLIPQQTELIPLLPASTAEGPMVEGDYHHFLMPDPAVMLAGSLRQPQKD